MRDESPEHRQGSLRSHVSGDNHRAMAMKTGQVEAAVGDAPHPQADALARDTSLLGCGC